MKVSELVIDRHVTEPEFRFARNIEDLILAKDPETIVTPVGSRVTHETRLSLASYRVYCRDLPFDDYTKWFDTANKITKDQKISAGNIRALIPLLPKNCPAEIIKMLTYGSGHYSPDADLDFALNKEVAGWRGSYPDKPWPEGSGLVVEVFWPGDEYKLGLLDPYSF